MKYLIVLLYLPFAPKDCHCNNVPPCLIISISEISFVMKTVGCDAKHTRIKANKVNINKSSGQEGKEIEGQVSERQKVKRKK